GPQAVARAGARVDPRGRAARGHAGQPAAAQADACGRPCAPFMARRAGLRRRARPLKFLRRRSMTWVRPRRDRPRMSFFEHGSWSRPSAPAKTAHRADAPRNGDAVSFLFTGGNDPARESRRITLGLVGLGVVSVILLNFGIYQSAQNGLVKERWIQLGRTTDTKRDQMRILFQNF